MCDANSKNWFEQKISNIMTFFYISNILVKKYLFWFWIVFFKIKMRNI